MTIESAQYHSLDVPILGLHVGRPRRFWLVGGSGRNCSLSCPLRSTMRPACHDAGIGGMDRQYCGIGDSKRYVFVRYVRPVSTARSRRSKSRRRQRHAKSFHGMPAEDTAGRWAESATQAAREQEARSGGAASAGQTGPIDSFYHLVRNCGGHRGTDPRHALRAPSRNLRPAPSSPVRCGPDPGHDTRPRLFCGISVPPHPKPLKARPGHLSVRCQAAPTAACPARLLLLSHG